MMIHVNVVNGDPRQQDQTQAEFPQNSCLFQVSPVLLLAGSKLGNREPSIP